MCMHIYIYTYVCIYTTICGYVCIRNHDTFVDMQIGWFTVKNGDTTGFDCKR